MTIKIKIDKNKGIAYIKLFGSIYENDVRKAFISLKSNGSYQKDMHRVWDLSEADLSSIDNASLESLAKASRSYPPEYSKAKVAVVAPQDLEFGLMRIYERISERKDYIFAPFRSLEQAEKWLIESD